MRNTIKWLSDFCYLHCGWVQLRDTVLSWLGKSRVVIVYYHRLGEADVLTKAPEDFRAEMAYLKAHYQCLTLGQLHELLASGKPIRRKTVAVTFDDGYQDNFTLAFPELMRQQVPATFFVATGYMGTDRIFPHDRQARQRGAAVRDDLGKLSWDEIRQMQQGGMEIGSHTVEHANMGRVDETTMKREIEISLQTLQRELGALPRAFCFPWGKPEDTPTEAFARVRQAGYYAAVTTSPGKVRRGDDLYRLRRIDVGNGHMNGLRVQAVIEGFGWGWLARHLH